MTLISARFHGRLSIEINVGDLEINWETGLAEPEDESLLASFSASFPEFRPTLRAIFRFKMVRTIYFARRTGAENVGSPVLF